MLNVVTTHNFPHLSPVYDFPISDDEEPGVADVGRSEHPVRVRQHHDAGGGGADYLLLGLLHLQEALS